MAPLFGDSRAGGRRDVLERRMIWAAHRVLCSGSPVVLDSGRWSPEERYAIRAVAGFAAADPDPTTSVTSPSRPTCAPT